MFSKWHGQNCQLLIWSVKGKDDVWYARRYFNVMALNGGAVCYGNNFVELIFGM